MNDLKFICYVKSQETLYRCYNKAFNTNNIEQLKLWESVAQDCELKSAKDAQQKWQQLTQNYLEYLRSGDDKTFQYSKEMQFMQPHILSDGQQESHSDLEIEEIELKRMLYSDEECETDDGDAVTLAPPKRMCQQIDMEMVKVKEELICQTTETKNDISVSDASGPSMKSVAGSPAGTYSSSSATLNSLTSLELIFLGYARELQKMPLALQLQTKRKISDIMDEAEMKMLDAYYKS